MAVDPLEEWICGRTESDRGQVVPPSFSIRQYEGRKMPRPMSDRRAHNLTLVGHGRRCAGGAAIADFRRLGQAGFRHGHRQRQETR